MSSVCRLILKIATDYNLICGSGKSRLPSARQSVLTSQWHFLNSTIYPIGLQQHRLSLLWISRSVLIYCTNLTCLLLICQDHHWVIVGALSPFRMADKHWSILSQSGVRRRNYVLQSVTEITHFHEKLDVRYAGVFKPNTQTMLAGLTIYPPVANFV